MELIFNAKFFSNVMESLNYDANKLPLGKMGKSTITSLTDDLQRQSSSAT